MSKDRRYRANVASFITRTETWLLNIVPSAINNPFRVGFPTDGSFIVERYFPLSIIAQIKNEIASFLWAQSEFWHFILNRSRVLRALSIMISCSLNSTIIIRQAPHRR